MERSLGKVVGRKLSSMASIHDTMYMVSGQWLTLLFGFIWNARDGAVMIYTGGFLCNMQPFLLPRSYWHESWHPIKRWYSEAKTQFMRLIAKTPVNQSEWLEARVCVIELRPLVATERYLCS